MVKSYSLFLLLSIFLSNAYAQHFSFDPGDHHEETVSALEYSDHTIYMENLTGGELTLGWERLEMDLPATWTADLCDYVGCYMGVPESGLMLPISDTTRGFLSVTINPNDTPGTGAFVFKVYDNKHPEFADTCTFVIHATGLTAIASKDGTESLSVYPVPAHDDLYISSQRVHANTRLKIYDVRGQLVLEQHFAEDRNTKISVRHLQGGVYLVHLIDEQGIIERKKILIQ